MGNKNYILYINGYKSGIVRGVDCNIDSVEEFMGIARGTFDFEEFRIYDKEGQAIYFIGLCNDVKVTKGDGSDIEVYIER